MAKKQRIPVILPKGFKAITGGFGDAIDWKEGVVVTGPVLEIKTITKKNPKKGEAPTTRLLRVKTKDGEKTVWEKATLRGLFDSVKKGQVVYIEHVGMGVAKKGQSAPHLFVAGIK